MSNAEEERRAADRRDTERRVADDPKFAEADRRKADRRERSRRNT